MAIDEEIIHLTVRRFASIEPLIFVSLKIKVFSMESLSWVLQSLFSDEMTPLETAIKNRIKEAFLLKIEPNVWQGILTTIHESAASATGTEISSSEPNKFKFRLVPVSTAQTDFQD
jgi:hypothetical protein